MNQDEQWGSNEDLLTACGDALRQAGDLEPSRSAGRTAWAQRTSRQDLVVAGLQFDSYFDDTGTTRSGGGGARVLVLGTEDGLGMSLEVEDDCLFGQVLPPREGDVTILCGTGLTASAPSDDLGCFSLPLPSSPFRLRFCSAGAEVQFATTWIHL